MLGRAALLLAHSPSSLLSKENLQCNVHVSCISGSVADSDSFCARATMCSDNSYLRLHE